VQRSTTKWFRPLSLLLALVLVAGACGGRDDDASPTTDPAPSDGEDDGGEPAGDPEPAPGFDGTTIRLGALTPTSGLVAIIGDPLTAGNQAYIDYVNEELGGIAGKYQIELVIEDTAYDPSTASQKYAAVRDEVAAFVQILGTPITNALLADLIDDDIVGSPASLDSAWVREPNLLALGGPYQVQAINGIDWWFSQDENADDVLCTLASDDEYGDAGVTGAEFAADNIGIDIAVKAEFPAPSATRPAQDFQAQISQMQSGGCDVFLFVATPTDTGGLAGALLENTSYNPVILGQSPTWLGLFSGNAYLQEYYYSLSEGTEFGDESVPGMAELLRIKDTYAPDQAPDIYFNFGYIQAKAMVQVLEKAVELGDLSRTGILRALEEVDTLTFDGLSGDYVYGPAEDRVPPTVTSIFRVDTDNPTGLGLVDGDYEASYISDFKFE
jgi:ABC-type branched-subunit amino acid transport system substrate-binding protein